MALYLARIVRLCLGARIEDCEKVEAFRMTTLQSIEARFKEVNCNPEMETQPTKGRPSAAFSKRENKS